jgi:uncharacterized protein (DUF1697 family)
MNSAAPIYIFLRGINVGSIRIGMADLVATLRSAGYTDVQTVLATGNVVCRPPTGSDTAATKTTIERVLSERFGYTATVHLRTHTALVALCMAARQFSDDLSRHQYALIADGTATVSALEEAFTKLPVDPQQSFTALGADALWVVPKGQTLTAPFGKIVLSTATYKTRVTSRTVATVERLLQLGVEYVH